MLLEHSIRSFIIIEKNDFSFNSKSLCCSTIFVEGMYGVRTRTKIKIQRQVQGCRRVTTSLSDSTRNHVMYFKIPFVVVIVIKGLIYVFMFYILVCTRNMKYQKDGGLFVRS